MLKRLAITVICFLALQTGFSQQDHFTSLRKVGSDIVDFTIDNLGNIYALTSGNQLKKIGIKGDSLGVYNDVKRFGKLYSIDASNPLRLVLFYRDFGSVVILDRFLNVRTTINLRSQNIFQVRAVCQSYDNGIWLYDEQEGKLKKLNDEGQMVSQSSDFRMFLDKVPVPAQLADQEKLVYLYDPAAGLFTFDYYGTLRNKVALLDWTDFQVVEGKVFGRKGTNVMQYAPSTLDIKEENQGFLTGVDKVQIGRDYLYCLKAGSIGIFAIKK